MGTHPIFESDFDCLTDLGEMEVRSELPDEIKSKCEEFLKRLDAMSEALKPVTEIDQSSRSKMDPWDQAKLDLLSVYSINSLAWLYQVANGVDPKKTSLIDELQRIQANMKKIKEIEDKKKRITVNSEEAKRIVSHELHEYESKKPRANTQ